MTRNVSGWFVPVVLLGVTAYALAEDLTLTTYYPSPRGVYKELRTSGDVAIGMTGAPSARLQVVGSLNAPALYVVGQGGTTTLRVDDHPDAGGDPTPFLINSDGNVGIGTSSPSGSAKLDVQGRVKIADGTQGDNKVLTSDANGLATWQSAAVPSGFVGFFNLASCPNGWTELTSARGRYLVGLPSGGTLASTAGTALTNLENRAVGAHAHTVTDPGHSHTYSSSVGTSGASNGWTGQATSAQTSTGMTGITIGNAGSVAGTNAPYIQLLVCQKD